MLFCSITGLAVLLKKLSLKTKIISEERIFIFLYGTTLPGTLDIQSMNL